MTSPRPRTVNPRSSSLDDTTENFADWVRLHASQLTIGVIAVAVLGGGYYLWRGTSARTASRAETALFEAQAPLLQGNTAAAQKQLQDVAQRYDGTAAGAQAQMALAQTYFEEGKYPEGLAALKQADDAPKSLANAVRQLTGVGLEGMDRYADAARTYAEAAANASSDAERRQLQADAARNYQLAGDKPNATRLWTELSKVTGTGVADEARVRLGEVTVMPAR